MQQAIETGELQVVICAEVFEFNLSEERTCKSRVGKQILMVKQIVGKQQGSLLWTKVGCYIILASLLEWCAVLTVRFCSAQDRIAHTFQCEMKV